MSGSEAPAMGRRSKFLSLAGLVVLVAAGVVMRCATCRGPQTRQATATEQHRGERKPRILFVDSYHEGHPWSEGITQGLLKTLKVRRLPNGELDCRDGLAGEGAPLGARITQVADCIDAMLMERTYKKSYTVEKMLAELTRCTSTQFDPKVAAAALAWCQSHREALFLPGKAAPACREVA
jgi:hypothetical protein